MVTPDHYNTLGLNPTCDDAVIREVYLALMRQYHPDRNPSGAAAVRARAITAAYAVLGNPEERSNYDGTRVPILMINEPPNSQSPRRTSTPTAWFTAAAALGRRAITAADARAKALRDRTQSALAPARLRSAKAVASRQSQVSTPGDFRMRTSIDTFSSFFEERNQMLKGLLSSLKRGDAGEEVSVVSEGMLVDGNLVASQQILIEGRVHGDVTCGTLLQRASGVVVGNINAGKVRIGGTVRGDIVASAVALQSTARVMGDITYDALLMEPGSQVHGRLCRQASGSQDTPQPTEHGSS